MAAVPVRGINVHVVAETYTNLKAGQRISGAGRIPETWPDFQPIIEIFYKIIAKRRNQK
jgi:hypothetical protein